MLAASAFGSAVALAGRAVAAGAPEGITKIAEAGRLIAAGRTEAALRLLAIHLVQNSSDAAVRDAAFRIVGHRAVRDTAIEMLEGLIPGATGYPVVLCGLYLVACAERGTAPRLEIASAVTWAAGFRWLMDDRQPEYLRPIMAPLAAKFPRARMLADMAGLLARVPAPRGGMAVADRLDAPVQFWPSVRDNVDTLAIFLLGQGGALGMPLNFFHRWVAQRPVHALYLRDIAGSFFRRGLSGLGDDWQATVDLARRFAEASGMPRIAVYGNSMGGFPAVRIAFALGAERVACVSGVVDGRPPGIEGWEENEHRPARRAATARDLDGLFAGPGRKPLIVSVYSGDNADDAEDAALFVGRPGARVVALPDHHLHNTAIELAKRGKLEHLVGWATGDDAAFDRI